jgi:fatty acid desaturase
MLWPAFGGHWIDLAFLNWLRPRLPKSRPIQVVARITIWFVGGMVLALGVRLTAMLLSEDQPLAWLTWATAGTAFVAIELVAHAGLHLRGRPSFYNGLG